MQTHLAVAEQRAQLAEQQALKSAEAFRNGGKSLTLTRNSDDSTMVDKRVVAKMLTTYLDCDSHEEVLELIARVLVRTPTVPAFLICCSRFVLCYLFDHRTWMRSKSAVLG